MSQGGKGLQGWWPWFSRDVSAGPAGAEHRGAEKVLQPPQRMRRPALSASFEAHSEAPSSSSGKPTLTPAGAVGPPSLPAHAVPAHQGPSSRRSPIGLV